jgi:hypothetical protein
MALPRASSPVRILVSGLSMPPSSGRAVVLYTDVRAADERSCISGHGSGEVEIPGRSLCSLALALFIARVRFFPHADPLYLRVRVSLLISFPNLKIGLFYVSYFLSRSRSTC